MVAVVQLVRASDCGSECRGFESHLPPIRSSSSELLFLFPPISQARSQAYPAHSQAHPVYIQAPTPPHRHRPRKTRKHPTPSGAHPGKAGGYLGKAGEYLGKAGGRPGKAGGYLHAAADHLGQRASDDTSIRTVRYVHPRRPIRASNNGHHTAEHTHNQCLADRRRPQHNHRAAQP